MHFMVHVYARIDNVEKKNNWKETVLCSMKCTSRDKQLVELD